LVIGLNVQLYLEKNKKKTEAEGKNCHAKTMLSLEKPIELIGKTPHMCALGKSPRSKYEGRSKSGAARLDLMKRGER
jgi:hypothetical protein